MADDRAEPREVTWRTLLPWTELFRGFKIALDLNKLLLAAAGLLLTALGWAILAFVFGSAYKDVPPGWTGVGDWAKVKAERDEWNLMHRAAGIGAGDKTQNYDAVDLADSPKEVDQIRTAKDNYDKATKELRDFLETTTPLNAEQRGRLTASLQLAAEEKLVLETQLVQAGMDPTKAARVGRLLGRPKPAGLMNAWPWYEDRGPNPYLLATGQVRNAWEPGHFWDWFAFKQAPVLLEPLFKLLRPIVYFFTPHATGFVRFYFFCVLVWTLGVWSLFGGAITRIAAVQIARNERIGMREALSFTKKRLLYYVTAPLFPLVFVVGLLIVMMIYGYFFMIPVFGDIVVSGLFWWVMIGFGLLMAVALIGLIGWPLMAATISTEGTDSWEAVSRSYTYVFQRPWQYIWYSLVAICYGAVVVFFVGFMGSFMVYLSKWGVGQTIGIQAANREPSFLFAYAPTSFGWRTLLLDGVVVDSAKIVQDGEIKQEVYNKYVGRDEKYQNKPDQLSWWNKLGAGLVAFWVGLLFLLVLGFGYSFFWSSATIIYLLMRKSVDTAELDEVYLEEDDQEGAYSGPLAQPAPAPAPAAKPTMQSLQVVESPSVKTPTSTTANPAPAPSEPKPADASPASPPPSSNGGATGPSS